MKHLYTPDDLKSIARLEIFTKMLFTPIFRPSPYILKNCTFESLKLFAIIYITWPAYTKRSHCFLIFHVDI